MLVARFERPLYNAAYRVVGDREDARDVTQVTFMQVAERIDEYRPGYRLFSWIYRIAVNAALNVARRKRRELPLSAWRAADVTPESGAAESERAARIQGALLELTLEHRTVIVLRHFSDASYREIAAVLSIDEKTVKSRLFEARQRLRALLPDLEGR